MSENAKAQYPDILSSGEMGPCITVAIYDTIRKCGYMSHQPGAEHNNNLENFITDTLSICEKGDVTVFVCGGTIDKGDEWVTPESVKNSRAYVKKLVFSHFDKKQVQISWGHAGTSSELILNTLNGEFSIERTKYQ